MGRPGPPITRTFEVRPGVVPSWTPMTRSGEVVANFLARVRVTGDTEAAEALMGPTIRCHQLVSEAPETILRTPREYALHVQEMVQAFGTGTYVVTDLLAEDDRVYVRWRHEGHHLLTSDGQPGTGEPVSAVGSAVYRVQDDQIVEYWIQLDRWGVQKQTEALDAAIGADT